MQIVTFKAERSDKTGLWWVTSPDHRGLLVCDRDLGKALAKSPAAMVFLLEAQAAWRYDFPQGVLGSGS